VRGKRVAQAAVVLSGVLVLSGCTRTSIEGLQVRSGPGTGFAVVGTIPEAGTPVRIGCWQRGEAVRGDTVWYRILGPQEGWVTNYYIRTTRELGSNPSC
jgi:uncharacterized protein YraI